MHLPIISGTQVEMLRDNLRPLFRTLYAVTAAFFVRHYLSHLPGTETRSQTNLCMLTGSLISLRYRPKVFKVLFCSDGFLFFPLAYSVMSLNASTVGLFALP